MFTFKHSILVIGLLAAGFVACGGGGDKTDAISISQGGALWTGGVGSGGAIDTGGSNVDSDAATGSGGSGGFFDAGNPVADALASEAGSAVVVGTKETNLALINAPAASGVVVVDVPGPSPPTYDPNTSTCK